MMIRIYLIMLEYLLVLIVDVWTSKKNVNWFNLFVEAMNNLMITIVENMNILNRIILHVLKTLIVFYWKLYGVGKLTYFILTLFLNCFICYLLFFTEPCMQNWNVLLKDASHNTYCYYTFWRCYWHKKKKKVFIVLKVYELNIYDYMNWIYELNIYLIFTLSV